MGFEIIDDITMADIAVNITGESAEELFASGGLAVISILLGNPDAVSADIKKNIKLSDKGIEELLYNFLQELVFYKDADSVLFLPEKLEIKRTKYGYQLEGVLRGEKIDPKKHEFRVDIKAVTMHNFEVRNKDGLWSATVVFDV